MGRYPALKEAVPPRRPRVCACDACCFALAVLSFVFALLTVDLFIISVVVFARRAGGRKTRTSRKRLIGLGPVAAMMVLESGSRARTRVLGVDASAPPIKSTTIIKGGVRCGSVGEVEGVRIVSR